MRCDIHLHTEVKVQGVWQHYGHPNIDRRYGLFAKMAGVRDCPAWKTEPISAPKGVPHDMSIVTAISHENWMDDGHSHSWLDAQEICALEDWYREKIQGEWEDRFDSQFGCLFGNQWSDFVRYRNEVPEQIEDIRFVFWFDN